MQFSSTDRPEPSEAKTELGAVAGPSAVTRGRASGWALRTLSGLCPASAEPTPATARAPPP